MRLYTFVNFYISSIQQGIQTAHVVHELFNKYGMREIQYHDAFLQLHNWARNHKTIIVLNGGIDASLNDLFEFMKDPNNGYPFACFREDEQSLGGILTAVGIVLPAEIYEAAEMIRNHKAIFIDTLHGTASLSSVDSYHRLNDHDHTQFEIELIERMNQCPLAR